MAHQLPLPLKLDDRCLFDTYHPGPNEVAFATLHSLADCAERPPAVFLWGPSASGKSHLAQALIAALTAVGGAGSHVPLRELAQYGPRVLEGLEQAALVAIDDLDVVAGQADWEAALFALANALKNAGGCLLVTASAMPEPLGIQLPDLRGRLLAGGSFRLRRLESDEDREALVRLRAGRRGLEISDTALRWLLRHTERDVTSLLDALERLDAEALAARRRLSASFVRQVLAAAESPQEDMPPAD